MFHGLWGKLFVHTDAKSKWESMSEFEGSWTQKSRNVMYLGKRIEARTTLGIPDQKLLTLVSSSVEKRQNKAIMTAARKEKFGGKILAIDFCFFGRCKQNCISSLSLIDLQIIVSHVPLSLMQMLQSPSHPKCHSQ